MADTPNPRKRYAEALLYRVLQSSVWQRMASPTIGTDLENAIAAVIPDFVSNVGTDSPADADALLTGPDFTAATIKGVEIERDLIRAFGRLPRMIEVESGGGQNAAAAMEQDLVDTAATLLDGKFAGVVAGLSYDAVNGSDNDNALSIGTAGKTFLPPGILPRPTVESGKPDIGELLAEAMLDALQLLHDKGVIGGQVRGEDGPTGRATLVAPTQVTRQLVNYALKEGSLTTRESIGGQAAVEGGIAGLAAFEGRWGGLDIVTSKATGVATADLPWYGYVLPAGGVFKGIAFAPEIQRVNWSDRTDAYATDVVHISRWAAGVPRPEHVIRVGIAQK